MGGVIALDFTPQGNIDMQRRYNFTNWTTQKTLISENFTASGHYFGQPLDGSLGSGVIWASQLTSEASVYVNYSGLLVTYPNLYVMLSNTTNDVKFCNITSATVTITDNQHSAYFVNRTCGVQATTFDNYANTDLSPGGTQDIFNVMAHSGDIEAIKGVTLKNKGETKVRKNILKTTHLDVVEGFAKTTEGWRNFTVAAGSYSYIREIVTTLRQNLTQGAGIEMVFHNASTTTWGYYNQTGLNVTSCDNGTAVVACTNTNRYRRYFIFITGWNNSVGETSELHQLIPLQSTYYSTPADCMDTEIYPLTYSIPDVYEYSAVLLYAYCGRPSDTSWTTNFIDLRTVKSSTASGTTTIDTSVFLTVDGARSLTGDWNAGSYNITARQFIGNISWTNLTSYPAACPANSFVSQLDDSTTCSSTVGNSSNFTLSTPLGACWMKFTNGLMTTTNCTANN